MNKTINQYINQLHLDPKREAAVRKIVTLAGGSGGGGMVEITYAELKSLRDNAKLVPGCKYRMIDYETTTSQANTQAAGHPFDLILTALDEKTLDEKCNAIWSERDTDNYFANSNLAAWEVWYTLDNDSNRFAWAVEKGKKLIIDFGALGTPISIQATLNGTFDYQGNTYFKWDATLEGNTMYILTSTEDNLIGQTPLIYIIEAQMTQSMGTITNLIVNDKNGYGVIYRLIDEHNNDLTFDFKNIKQKTSIENTDFTEYYYTFDDYGKDGSIKTMYAYNNKFTPGYNDIPNIIIVNNTCYNNHIDNIMSMLVNGGISFNKMTGSVYKLFINNGFSNNISNSTFYNVRISGSMFNCMFLDDWRDVTSNAHVQGSTFRALSNINIKRGDNIAATSKSNFEFSSIIKSNDAIEINLTNYTGKQKYRVFYLNDEIKVISDEDIYNAIQATKSES